MDNRPSPSIKTGSGGDLAFAMVVLASYLAMFSAKRISISTIEIFLMAFLGVAYIAIGIYGYAFCASSDSRWIHMGYFAVQIPLGGLIVYLSKGAGFNALILLPLVGHAVILLYREWIYVVNAAIILTYVLSISPFMEDWSAFWSGLPTFLAGVIFIQVFTQMAVNEEKSRKEVERLVPELEQANQRLRGYAIQAEELAITKERNRLAREIHDGLGHYLTAIHIQAQAARAVLKPDNPQAADILMTIQNLSQEALNDVRQSVATLRASPEEMQPLPEMIEKMLDECTRTGIEGHFSITGTLRDLSPQAHLTLFRAAQEGINNTRKYAQATQIWLTLDFTEPGCVRLHVKDNGIGTDHFDGGFGLLGIQERAHLLNGQVKVLSTPGKGFSLEVTIPE